MLPHAPDYVVFNAQCNYIFNSYYETVGARVVRTDRGNLSRPPVADVRRYRAYVNAATYTFLATAPALRPALHDLLVLGLNHEEQHQELLITDIKYILGRNPLLPAYPTEYARPAGPDRAAEEQWASVAEGVYEIGATGAAVCFDNELGRHKVPAGILAATRAGQYRRVPGLYRRRGLRRFSPLARGGLGMGASSQHPGPVLLAHGLRLATEAEWEIAQNQLAWGTRWEWTESAYSLTLVSRRPKGS